MRLPKGLSKDHYGALMLLGLGAAVFAMGLGYRMGTLNRMGAGFIPVVLGALMVLVGVVLGVTAASPGQINAQLPVGVDGNGTLRVTTASGFSESAVTISRTAPAIFRTAYYTRITRRSTRAPPPAAANPHLILDWFGTGGMAPSPRVPRRRLRLC